MSFYQSFSTTFSYVYIYENIKFYFDSTAEVLFLIFTNKQNFQHINKDNKFRKFAVHAYLYIHFLTYCTI